MLTGCHEYGEKRIVSTVVADKDVVAVYYYDFTQESTAYLKEVRQNNGIKTALTEILSQNDYNLKMCRYAVVSEEIVNNGINEVFFALTDNRFAPDTVIIEGNTKLAAEDYENINKPFYPVYNYSFKNSGVNAVIEKISSGEKIIVIDNKVYRELDSSQSIVFDILCNVTGDCIYMINDNNTVIMAELNKANAFRYAEKNNLTINISAVLKSYKGMPSDNRTKESVCRMLEKDISYQVKSLLTDKTLADNFGILWYENTDDFEDISVNVNII